MAITDIWAGGSSADLTTPTATDLNTGFVCGPADPGLFNWLFNKITSCMISLQNDVTTLFANLAANQAQTDQNTADIASNATAINSNSTAISNNAAAIAALVSASTVANPDWPQGTIV